MVTNSISHFLTSLIQSPNQSYLRWKAILSASNPLRQEIIEQLNSQDIVVIFDQPTLRLILWKAWTCLTFPNRLAVIKACNRQLLLLRGKKYLWLEIPTTLVLTLFFLASILANAVLISAILNLIFQANHGYELFYTRYWAFFWANGLIAYFLLSLCQRLWKTELPPIFNEQPTWFFYIAGFFLAFLSQATLSILLETPLTDDSFQQHYLGLLTVLLPFLLSAQVAKPGFKLLYQPPLALVIMEAILQLFLLASIWDSLQYSLLSIVYISSYILRIIQQIRQAKYGWLSLSPNVLQTLFSLKNGLVTVAWGTSVLLTLKVLNRQNTIQTVPHQFLSIFGYLAGLLLIVLAVLFFHRALPKWLKIGSFDDLHHTNDLVYQLTTFKIPVPRQYPATVENWIWAFLFLRSIEKRGLARTLQQDYFWNRLPHFVEQLRDWNCSYLSLQLEEALEDWGYETGKIVGQKRRRVILATDTLAFIELQDFFLQQLPLLEWHLYHEFHSQDQQFPFKYNFPS